MRGGRRNERVENNEREREEMRGSAYSKHLHKLAFEEQSPGARTL